MLFVLMHHCLICLFLYKLINNVYKGGKGVRGQGLKLKFCGKNSTAVYHVPLSNGYRLG